MMMKSKCIGKVIHWEKNVKERIALARGELDCVISRGNEAMERPSIQKKWRITKVLRWDQGHRLNNYYCKVDVLPLAPKKDEWR